MVTRQHRHLHARGPAGDQRLLDAVAGRVVQPEQAQELQLSFGLLGRVGGADLTPRATGDREDAQPLPCQLVDGALCEVERVGRGASWQHGVGRALGHEPVVGHDRRATTLGIEGEAVVDVVGTRCEGRVESPRERVDGRLHRIADRDPDAVPFVCVALAAGERGTSQRRGSRGGPPAIRRPQPSARYPSPWMCTDPAGVHVSTTAISLRVRVPVLSVQMNVVEPSVSTACR